MDITINQRLVYGDGDVRMLVQRWNECRRGDIPNLTNRLESETSPYLIQHAENPVDWFPWGDEALRRAEAEDKPIFLSIGYSACHWCHVMGAANRSRTRRPRN